MSLNMIDEKDALDNHDCHSESSKLMEKHETDCVMSGYAYLDGCWWYPQRGASRYHSWSMKDEKIVDIVLPAEIYVGYKRLDHSDEA
jgi:hypothetical protein